MKSIFCFGVVAAALLLSTGCNDTEKPSNEAEMQQINESPDYEKEMMGGTGATEQPAE